MRTMRLYAVASAVAFMMAFPAPGRAQHEEHQHAAPTAAPDTLVAVTGTVLCVDGPALSSAVVRVFRGADTKSTLVASALTDPAGKYRMRLPAGNYHVRVTYLGHGDFDQDINVGPAPLSIPPIRLQYSPSELQALVASVERDRVRTGPGTMVYDVKKAGNTAGGSVTDALRSVPGLDIAADGSITVRGSANVLILFNGQPSALKGDALIAFLKQMPASALQRIETSTTAGAARDAQGSAGIVDLVFDNTTASRSVARSASASAATAGQYMLALSGTAARDNANVVGSYAFSMLEPATYSHTMRDNLLLPEQLRTSHQESFASATHRLHSAGTSAVFRAGAGSTFTAGLAYTWMRGAYDNRTQFADISTTGAESNAFVTASTLEHTIPTGDASIAWKLQRGGPAQLSVATEARASGGNEKFAGSYTHGDGVAFLETGMQSKHRQYSLASDVLFEIAHARFALGQKLQQRSVEADYETTGSGPNTNSFSNVENVQAAYANAERSFSHAVMTGGIRVERSSTTIDMGGVSDDVERATSLFPSISTLWTDEERGLRYHASVARRIDRPDAAALNPYSMGEDDMNAFIGNPMLRPERSDQLELGIEKRWLQTTVTASPFYRYSRDAIRPIKAVTESGRSTTTLRNIARTRTAGADITLVARISPRISTMLSSSVYYLVATDTAVVVGAVDSRGAYATVRASMDVQLSEQSTLQLYAYRRGPQPVEQGHMVPVTSSDIALSHRFGSARNGLLTLRVRDPLNGDRIAFRLSDPSFSQWSERKVTSRMAVLSLSWNVGGDDTHTRARPGSDRAQIF